MSRITEFKFDSGHLQTYTYDVFGNLTGITTTPPGGGSVPRSLPVLGLTNRLSGGVYDAAGNLTSWGAYTYQVDAFGMMTRMLGAGNDNTHLYTADDERLWTIDAVLGGGEAGATHTFRLRDSDSEVLREYRLLGTNVAGHWSQVKDYLYRDGGNLLSSISPSAGTVHYTLDHLGTPRLVTNSTGGYVSDHHYYAYGEELNPSTAETKKFTGHERDFNEAGQGTTDDLDYAHARYCSPITGRFLSVDRAEAKLPKPQSWNRYAYTEGNPLKYSDPDGNESRAEIMFNQDVEDLTEGRITREEFRDRLNARGAPALFAISLLAPGPEDVILAAAAGKLLGRVGAFFARIFGKADEIADVAADAARASKSGSKSVDDMAAELRGEVGKNRVQTSTPNEQVSIDLQGKSHFDKATGTSIPTPHVQTRQIHTGPNGQRNAGPAGNQAGHQDRSEDPSPEGSTVNEALATVALANWYAAHCNGEWEHSFGVKIDTIDNPGWLIEIDLKGTDLEGREIPPTKFGESETDWMHLCTRDGKFIGAGDPGKLEHLLVAFLEFASTR